MSPRHNRRQTAAWHHPSSSGKGHSGRGVMKTRRRDSGMTKEAFEELLRKLDIRGRR